MSSSTSDSIFKAYDIRGIYGQSLTDDLAFKLGRAFATFLKPHKVVVGRDMRPHSVPLFGALARGLTLQGVDVVDLGMCSTPMCYFADGNLGADAGIMITASHNPGEWNGFKLCREQAIPISGATGIKDLEKIVLAGAFAPAAAQPGTITTYDVVPNYVARIRQYADIRRPLRVCVDFANSMGLLENKVLDGLVQIDPMFDTLDGTFPNHEANPLKLDTLTAIQKKMRAGKYDFGEIIPMDIITALIAQVFLKKQKGNVFYDLRSSWAVKEVIAENGGTPMMSRVGHAFIKAQMRAANAIFAGELSGHYYFRENYFAESSSLAALSIANLVSAANVPLSALIKPIQRYFASGEINSEVHDPKKVLDGLRKKYTGGKVTELDGLSVEYSDWWFNVRSSNTEPLVRLNLEAKTKTQKEQKRDELLALIRA